MNLIQSFLHTDASNKQSSRMNRTKQEQKYDNYKHIYNRWTNIEVLTKHMKNYNDHCVYDMVIR